MKSGNAIVSLEDEEGFWLKLWTQGRYKGSAKWDVQPEAL